MKFLSKEQIIMVHSMLIKHSGGLDGIRDENLLDSALHAPFQTFDNEQLYPTVQKKAACLCFGFINNHAFIDGNKRIGVLAMMIFLELNGIGIDCTDEDLVNLGLGIASGQIGQEQILTWILDVCERNNF